MTTERELARRFLRGLRSPLLLRPLAAAGSGLLLAASFPPLEWGDAAWVALVPLLLALQEVRPREAFRLGFSAGAVFYLFSLAWLTHVTVAGWLALALYCALYLGGFAVMSGWCMRRLGTERSLRNIALLVLVAALWVGFEYGRSVLFTGFPWNALGISQYRNLPVIQIARWGGVYAVSALVLVVNTGMTLTVLRYVRMFRGRRERTRHTWRRIMASGRQAAEAEAEAEETAPRHARAPRFHAELMVALFLVASVLFVGLRSLLRAAPQGTEFLVTAVQPNVPQPLKWDEDQAERTHQALKELSEFGILVCRVIHGRAPDLLVWPETAVPDFVLRSETSSTLVRSLLTNGVPILVGSMDLSYADDLPVYYNSSILFNPDGTQAGKYDKQHLVVFGEYVPLERVVPFIRALTPIRDSFSPGHEATVFRVRNVPFSALICFEDTMARLASRFVRQGARMLVNQTNDAWFDPSAGSRQHLCHCVFRCVENRVPSVRAANTGVTCAIDRTGRITRMLKNAKGEIRTADALTMQVWIPAPDMPLTFYTRYGDVFARICAGALLATAILALTRRRSVR